MKMAKKNDFMILVGQDIDFNNKVFLRYRKMT